MTHMEKTAALPLEDADLFRERALIGGAWVEAASGAQVAVTDPATGRDARHMCPTSAAAETRAAIEAAEAAFGPWRRRTHGERAALLEAWFALMQAHAEDLAQILTAEQGKPLAEARGEIALWRLLRQMVRRGGAADRRDRSSPRRRPTAAS